MYLGITPENELDIEKMFSAYVKQVIVRSRQKYNKSYVTRLQREELTQNSEIDNLLCDSHNNLEEEFQIEKCINLDSAHIEKIFTDEKMYSIVKNLKPKQKFVLYLLYYKNRSEQETADILSISRQRVNKIKNEVLEKIMFMYLSKQ